MFNKSSDSLPQNIDQYQCSPNQYILLKAVAGLLIALSYFEIHELWNLRMISYQYNKHDCKKSKCLCLEKSRKISKYCKILSYHYDCWICMLNVYFVVAIIVTAYPIYSNDYWSGSIALMIFYMWFGVYSIVWLSRQCALICGCIISKYSIVSSFVGVIIPITYDIVLFDAQYTFGFIAVDAISFFPLIIGSFVICILLLLSSFEDYSKFAMITFAILLQFLTTDVNLIFEWIANENNIFWASMQAITILTSQIVASMKMGNFDNIQQMDNYTLSMKNSISKFDRFMTLIGLGRAWIACKCIANYKLYYVKFKNL